MVVARSHGQGWLGLLILSCLMSASMGVQKISGEQGWRMLQLVETNAPTGKPTYAPSISTRRPTPLPTLAPTVREVINPSNVAQIYSYFVILSLFSLIAAIVLLKMILKTKKKVAAQEMIADIEERLKPPERFNY